jgi:hypothetical protein
MRNTRLVHVLAYGALTRPESSATTIWIDFPYRQFYLEGSGVRIARVDLRAENIGRRAAVDLGVVGDVA